jgi:2-oxoisovalerate dehydrogenase E1 component
VTILTIGPSLYPALEAADQMKASGLSAEVIDARSLVPFDYDLVLASVKKTGRLLIVTEAPERGSFAMTLASNVTRFGFASLLAPPRVLGAPNWIVPGADMESTYFPHAGDILDVVLLEMFPDRNANRSGIRTWDDRELARGGL